MKEEKTKRSTFAVLFYINRAKQKKNGLCSIMGRITIDAGIVVFTTKAGINPNDWNAKTGRTTGKTREAVRINQLLDRQEAEIREHYSRMVLEDGYVTAENIKNALNGIGRKATRLLELFREHNREAKLRVGVNLAEVTFKQNLLSYRHLSDFIQYRYHSEDVALNSLNHDFINAYDLYLQVEKHNGLYAVRKHIILLRRIVRLSIRRGILKRNPFMNYTPEKPAPQRRHLTMEEFQRILNTPVQNKSLERIRDIFLFACFTGMAYADIRNLSEKHLIQDEEGAQWIKIERKKTGTECNIRLFKVAVRIMDKYRSERTNDKIFQMNTLVHLDRQLKKIAALCGIESNLSFHLARHTYATQVCLSQGVPIETLSRMMGHSSTGITQIYAKITNQKLSEDMKILSSRIENKYSLPEDDMPENYGRNQYYH